MKAINSKLSAVLVLALVLCAQAAEAKPKKLSGMWQTPMGKVRVTQQGSEVTGVLVSPAAGCSIKKGSKVLGGVLMEDNLTGEITVCLTGDGCQSSFKAFVLLLVAKNGRALTGALHLPKKSCQVRGLGKRRGLRMTRLGKRGPRKPAPVPRDMVAVSALPASEQERIKLAQKHLLRGKELMTKGSFDHARKAFEDAIAVDPSEASGYSGIGVTFYARNQYTDALLWYKKALDIDPDFGDAYYNMACIYALEDKKELALRYLRIAILNNYLATYDPEDIAKDEDFAKLREDPEFRALLRGGAAAEGGATPQPESAPQPAAAEPPVQD